MILVQVGQAGNQVGGELWGILEREVRAWGDGDAAARDSLLGPTSPLRETPGGGVRARCVLVDTEPKAVRGVLGGAGGALLAGSAAVCGHSGRGNNWANGYQQPGAEAAEGELLELAREGVRAEAERCDGPLDLVLLHSLAGGTGSGLGSRLLESLRADYDHEYVVAGAVAPRRDGDSSLQSLNTLLAAQWHQAYADAVLLFQNDPLLRAAPGGLGGVNGYIGAVLAGCLLPLTPPPGGGGGGGAQIASPVREIVTGAAPEPSLKFLEAHTAPAAGGTTPRPAAGAAPPWASVFRELAARAGRFEGERGGAATSTATVAIPRGTGTRAAGAEGEGVAEVLRALRAPSSPYLHAAWQAPGDAVTVLPSAPPALPASGLPRTLTVVSNRSSSVGVLEAAVRRAEPMIRAGAYAHWYERHGCPREALWDALDATADIVESYRHWHG